MKSKIFKISSVFILSIMVSLCLPMLFKLNKRTEEVSAAGVVVENTVESSLILEAGAVINNPKGTAAGTATGYNKFLLNEENVTLTATVADGYKVVGWQVVLKEQEDKTQFLSAGGKIQTKNGEDVDVSLTYSDEIRTDCYKTSTFTLDRVFEDMVVTPVFDFMYYHLDITDFKEEIELPSNSFSPNASVTVYYTSVTEDSPEDGIDKYDGVIAKIGSSLYYCGTVYAKGTSFYTLHNNQKIDIFANNGAFRIGDEITAEFEIDTIAAHIDLLGVYNLGNACVVNNKVLTEQTKLTEKFNFTTNVVHTANYINDLELNYDSLHKVTIKALVDEVAADAIEDFKEGYNVTKYTKDSEIIYCYDGEFYKMDGSARIPVVTTAENLTNNGFTASSETVNYTTMFKVADGDSGDLTKINSSMIVVKNAYSKIDDCNFYAKNSGGLKVEAKAVYSELSLGTTYNYFTLSKFDDTEKVKYKTYFPENDITVNIKYQTNTKQITYKSGELINGEVQIKDSLETKGAENVSIGSTKTVNAGPDNIGYYIYGYKIEGSANAPVAELNVKINHINPSDVSVIICYAPIKYTIKIESINDSSVKLNDGTKDIYAINSLSFNAVTTANDDNSKTDISVGKAYIGDLVSVGLNLNDGFNATLDLNDFTITKEWIEANSSLIALDAEGKTGTITLTAEESLINYSLTYSINAVNVEHTELYKRADGSYFVASDVVINNVSTFDSESVVTINSVEYTLYTNAVDGTKTHAKLYKRADDSYFIFVDIAILGEVVYESGTESEVIVEGETCTLYSNAKASTILANIGVKRNGTTVELDASNYLDFVDAETSAIGKQIVLTDLHYYDNVQLLSSEVENRYFFKWFTASDAAFSGNVEGENAYQYEVNSDFDVSVVYSLKEVVLKIESNKPNAANLSLITVTSDIVSGNNTDGFKVGWGEEITVTLPTNTINFGYNLVAAELTNNGSTDGGAVTINGNVLKFTALDGVQILTLQFDVIKYNVSVEQHGYKGAEDGTKVDFGGNDYIELDVENSVLTFTKPNGVYISKVESGTNVFEDLQETNAVNRNAYTKDLKDYLQLIVGESTKGVLKVTYSPYTYTVNIIKSGFDGVAYPNLEYVVKGEGPGQFEKVEKVEDIPYGAVVTISLSEMIPVGITFGGWDVGDTISNSNVYEINGITANYDIEMVFSNTVYNIKYVYNSTMGMPKITDSLNADKETLMFADKIKIHASAKSGYKSTGVYISSYVPYEYDEDNWNTIKGNLFKIESGYYTKINLEDYDGGTYYKRDLTSVAGMEIDSWSIDRKNEIVINDVYYVEYCFTYELKQFKLVNENADYVGDGSNGYSLNNNDKDIKISYADYASHIVKATRTQNGTTTDVEDIKSDTLFNIYDTITVTIQVNNEATNSVDGSIYDLTKGLSLITEITIIDGVKTTVINNGNGEYIITFNVVDVINKIGYDESLGCDVLTIAYPFVVNAKKLTLKTNIGDNNFYGAEKAVFGVYADATGYGQNIDSNETKAAGVVSTIQFLGKSQIQYNLEAFKNNFKIESFYVEYGTGADKQRILITKEDYENVETGIKELLDSLGVYPDWDKMEGENNDVPVHEGLDTIDVRYIEDLLITLNIQPILYFEGNRVTSGDYTFEKEFKVDADETTGEINAVAQNFVINNNIGKDTDITIVDTIFSVSVKFRTKGSNDTFTSSCPSAIGEYELELTISGVGADFGWLNGVGLPFNVYLKIYPTEIGISCNAEDVKHLNLSKTYNGNSEFVDFRDASGNIIDKVVLLKLLKFHIGEFTVSYDKLMNIVLDDSYTGFDLTLNHDNVQLVISQTTNDGEQNAINANENLLYNLQINGLELNNGSTRNSFAIKTSSTSVLLKNVYKINKKELEIDLTRAIINNKVYDATNIATFAEESKFGLIGVVGADTVKLDLDKLELLFENSTVGGGKKVTVNASKALVDDFGNYTVKTATATNKTIYPASISVDVQGYGKVSVYNNRGLVDSSKVGLIPIGAELVVELIKPDTGEYAEIYPYIEKEISRTNVFAIGYKIYFEVDGEKQQLNSDLFLGLPYVEDLTKVYSLNGEDVTSIRYTNENGEVLVDLISTEGKFDALILTQYKPLLKLWQILLISIGGVVLVGGAVTTFVVLRIRRKRKMEERDTI